MRRIGHGVWSGWRAAEDHGSTGISNEEREVTDETPVVAIDYGFLKDSALHEVEDEDQGQQHDETAVRRKRHGGTIVLFVLESKYGASLAMV